MFPIRHYSNTHGHVAHSKPGFRPEGSEGPKGVEGEEC